MGGEENFGTTPREGGVYITHGRTWTSLARRGNSHAYQPSPSEAYQSAHEIPVRRSSTSSAFASARTLSTRSYSPGRNHSTRPIRDADAFAVPEAPPRFIPSNRATPTLSAHPSPDQLRSGPGATQ